MRVVLGAFEEIGVPNMILADVIEVTGCIVTDDAIAEDVFEVVASGTKIVAGDPGVTCPDDDAAAAGGDQAARGAHAGAHAAAERAGLDVTLRPLCAQAGRPGVAEHLLLQQRPLRVRAVAQTSKLGFEIVVCHGGTPVGSDDERNEVTILNYKMACKTALILFVNLAR